MSQLIYKQAVRAAFDNFVMVNQTLVKHFKNANPALFMGYLISEESFLDKCKKLDQYGYFFCKTDKLEEKYGFSFKVQDRLINMLVKDGLIEVIVKRVEGSESISKVKHFKVLHENVFNLVNGTTQEVEKETSDLPANLLDIQDALEAYCKLRRTKFVRTSSDKRILEIALVHGLCSEIINQTIQEKHKKLKGKCVTAKYLLTAYIPNISELENPEPEVEQLTRLTVS